MKALFALVAAFAAFALPASAGSAYIYGHDVSLQVVNDTKTPVRIALCPNGHVSISYQFGTRANPCNVTPEVYTLNGGGGKLGFRYKANPIGVVMTANGRETYFYAMNPSVGKPFVEIDGRRVSLVEGQLTTIDSGPVVVAFHRWGDEGGLKMMMIQIKKV